MGRVDIDRLGFIQQLQGKPKGWVISELVQNPFDEEGVTEVIVTIDAVPDKRQVHIVVEDDAPQGFKRLTDAYTMYTESLKVNDPSKAGRFNEGDKKVILFAEWAEIVTTKGTVRFEGEERQETRGRTTAGSTITAVIKGTVADRKEMVDTALSIIPPAGIKYIVNGEVVERRKPVSTFEAQLPTVHGPELRPTIRKTVVELYEPPTGRPSRIFECGIPVVETEDRYDINVLQRVPLNRERDNVTPTYLKTIRALVLNNVHEKLTPDEFTKPWVAQAVTDKHVESAAVNSYLDSKYTKDRVAFDPSSPESNSYALAQGTQVVHGRSEPKAVWDKAKEAGLIAPAGRVFPVKEEHIKRETIVPGAEWTESMSLLSNYSMYVARRLIGRDIKVSFVNDAGMGLNACYGQHHLTYNVGRLGKDFFKKGHLAVNRLLIHELGHEYEADHLSSNYYDALCVLGAKLAALVTDEPKLFSSYWKDA